MSREGTIGTATFLALAAVVGVSLQSGSKSAESRPDPMVGSKLAKQPIAKQVIHKERPGCSVLGEELKEFLAIKDLHLPLQCYEGSDVPQDQPANDLAQKTTDVRFVVALLPDPVHTHSSVLFDQFTATIQEGAQDEEYVFDSSWMPWDSDENTYPLLDDEKRASRERDWRQDQPGIILFRKNCSAKKSCNGDPSRAYREGLIVLVVGEDATHGIHREQFSNALDWIAAIRPRASPQRTQVGLLGPTFSGSFPSLAQVLKDSPIGEQLIASRMPGDPRLAIYSGSVTSNESAQLFQSMFSEQIAFHSFVQADEEVLARFCDYMMAEQPGFEPKHIAIISEDETAYGSDLREDVPGKTGNRPKPDRTDCEREALKLYYPRDISALRGAYQTKSLFDIGMSSQTVDAQKRNLPSDLADSTGKGHDSIRDYGGNQTPLVQEAFLMQIVSALRELHARYIILRSSNTLDQLFLANFLRRSYPDGRIVINGSDLMFIRERGSTGLSGAMTLSTYPLFPLERDWTEHQARPAADRTFSADTAEGTYVAFRLLLNDKSLVAKGWDHAQCHVIEPPSEVKNVDAIFVPPISCAKDPPIPDYSPPFWTLEDQCGERPANDSAKIPNEGDPCSYPGPATWLSVIGVNRFWPMASLTHEKPRRSLEQAKFEHAHDRDEDPVGLPTMPLGMKVFLLALMGFSVFHAWCCGSGSFTAQPVFRSHFASIRDLNHRLLVFGGSCCIAFLAIMTGWGCGVFSIPLEGLYYPWGALFCVLFVWVMGGFAILAYGRNSWKLSQDFPLRPDEPSASPGPWRITQQEFTRTRNRAAGYFLLATILFCLAFMVPLWLSRLVENSVLAQWRAMHLTSGVSPLVPLLAVLIGLYASFWFTLHGLALFGPDRPCLPRRKQLALDFGDGARKYVLRMFSQQNSAYKIEWAAVSMSWGIAKVCLAIFLLFCLLAYCMANGVPVRSLGSQNYSILFLLALNLCCTLSLVESFRLYRLWGELKRLLAFLDRLPLRRTLASLHGFSWGSVWKMSGNVLEVRYKVISRQMECMNHNIASLEEFAKTHCSDSRVGKSLTALREMRASGMKFAKWYASNYMRAKVGDLGNFAEFQRKIATASAALFTQLLVPAWGLEGDSLLVSSPKDAKDESAPLPKDNHLRNAEEFVCINYLSFIQNVLGRLRTMAMTIIALFVASALAMSSYPFDPRQALSAVLMALFVTGGVVIVKVYAEMHRDSTLSYVTNTKPGELGTEFWFKILGFGLAPMLGLMTRIFPGATDFIFAWLQPGISSLK